MKIEVEAAHRILGAENKPLIYMVYPCHNQIMPASFARILIDLPPLHLVCLCSTSRSTVLLSSFVNQFISYKAKKREKILCFFEIDKKIPQDDAERCEGCWTPTATAVVLRCCGCISESVACEDAFAAQCTTV
jgi:hypothetical protein